MLKASTESVACTEVTETAQPFRLLCSPDLVHLCWSCPFSPMFSTTLLNVAAIFHGTWLLGWEISFCFKTTTQIIVLLCLHIPGTIWGCLKQYVAPNTHSSGDCFCCQRMLLFWCYYSQARQQILPSKVPKISVLTVTFRLWLMN